MYIDKKLIKILETHRGETIDVNFAISLIKTIAEEHETEQLLIPRVSNCVDLERELKVTEQLLAERQRVLDAIPECKSHGSCVPHAIDWIEEMKAKHCC